jgi:hypothetical protein
MQETITSKMLEGLYLHILKAGKSSLISVRIVSQNALVEKRPFGDAPYKFPVVWT